MTEDLFRVKPSSIHRTLAEFYLRDADDFAQRFDCLWEELLQKNSRIKTFVDLLMGIECALKAHIFMSSQKEDPISVYRQIRSRGHSIDKLVEISNWMHNRDIYTELAKRLQPFSVFVRYRFDADQTFFPALMERDQADINYSTSIGRNAWVLEIRDMLEQLSRALYGEFNGFITDDLLNIFTHEQELSDFYKKVTRKK